jgi:hypothetical protein
VGRELDDEHHGVYRRAPTMRELLDAVERLNWTISSMEYEDWKE